MRKVLVRWGVLGGVLTLLLAGTWGLARADNEDKPKPKRDRLQHMMKRLEMLRKMMEEKQGGSLFPEGFDLPMLGGFARSLAIPEPRLGVDLRIPGETLAEQLDLPKDRGMVIAEVSEDSPAAKAGLKKHDILLEINGKAVPSKRIDFGKLIAGIKADKPVDAVVLRKGKKETVKGLILSEKVLPAIPEIGGLSDIPQVPLGNEQQEITTLTRNNDQFTATQKKGKATITVTGTVDQGKAKVSKVVIDDGKGKKEYDSTDKVPAEYKARVEKLANMSVGGKAVQLP